MLSDRVSLKLESMLRRAGFSGVPRPLLVGICLVCVVLVVIALWRFWPAASGESEDFAVVDSTAQATSDEASQKAADIYVDVEGAVAKPGMYTLPADARVADAVSAAGGLTDEAAAPGVNLAQKLEDGMQVYVPAEGQDAASDAVAAATGSAGSKINLNTASAEQLQQIDGIGPSLSQRIVDYRETHGRFKSVEELKEVSGIGDVRYETLKDAVCV